MAGPIRVSILADPKDFVSGLKIAEVATDQFSDELKAAQKILDGFDGSMKTVGDVADQIGGNFGRMGAGLSGVGDRLAEMNPDWAAAGKVISEVGKNMTLVADAADVVQGAMSLAQSAVQIMSKSQAALNAVSKISTAVQWLWNAALSANPIGIVVLAIAALVGGLIWFFTQTELGQKTWQTFMGVLEDLWTGFMDFITPIWDAIVTGFQWVVDNTKVVWEPIIKFFEGIATGIQGVFDTLGSWFKPAGGTAADNYEAGAETVDMTDTTKEIKTGMSGVPGSFKETGKKSATAFQEGVKSPPTPTNQVYYDAFGKPLWSKIDLSGDFRQIGVNAAKALADGIISQKQYAYLKVRAFSTGIVNTANNAMRIASPSKEFWEMGENIVAGLVKGIEQETPQAEKAVLGLVDAMSGTDLSGGLAEDAVRRGGTVIVIGEMEFAGSNAAEVNAIEQFVAMLQRKTKVVAA